MNEANATPLDMESTTKLLEEIVEGGENLGRWSVVASDPLWVVSAKEKTLKRRKFQAH